MSAKPASFGKYVGKLACRLNLHHWQTELRGHQFEGSVYPIRFRTCQRCLEVQKQVFDEGNNTVGWIKVSGPLA